MLILFFFIKAKRFAIKKYISLRKMDDESIVTVRRSVSPQYDPSQFQF